MRIQNLNSINFTGIKQREQKEKTQSKQHKEPAKKEVKTGYYPPLEINTNNTPSKASVLNYISTAAPVSEAGLKGVVYKLDTNNGSFAIKVGRSKEDDFSKEAKVLKKVPSELTGQKFVDYYKDPKTGKDVLVSTFAEGKKSVMQKREEFSKLFESLNVLDKAGVLHGDLNMGNWLANGDEINLIDYGEGSLFSAGDTYDEMYPNFILKTNIINLEQNGIPDCIKQWDKSGMDTKDNFKNYLQAKAEFFNAHKEIARQTGNKAAFDYEANLAEVLSDPDDDIIRNEAARMDVLYTFEATDTAVNYAKYPDSAIRNWNLTIQKAEDMRNNTAEKLQDENITPSKKKYFEYQNKIAQILSDTYKDWGSGTIGWIEGIEERPESELSEHEKTLKSNKGKEMEMPYNLIEAVFSEN